MKIREDETTRFVLIKDPCVTAIWKAAPNSCLFHATVNGLTSICPARARLTDEDPYPSTYDRSNDMMTCDLCAELVRRVRVKPPPERKS